MRRQSSIYICYKDKKKGNINIYIYIYFFFFLRLRGKIGFCSHIVDEGLRIFLNQKNKTKNGQVKFKIKAATFLVFICVIR